MTDDLGTIFTKIKILASSDTRSDFIHRVLNHPPPFLSVVKAGKNHFNEIGERYQIYVKQCFCSDVNSTYKQKC
jgi:hypothetical protein